MSLIALGVSGGIGVYKAVEVVRGLQRHGHEVVVVMTRSARRFVGPLTFEAITRRAVITSQFTRGANTDIEHIALASSVDLLLIAPATANIIGKLANGIADDVLSTLYLATRAPVLVAPAMNTQMLDHVAVADNISILRERGVRFIDPGEGFLACGWMGKGRLAEPEDIVAKVRDVLLPERTLVGRCVIVTAGPTYEDVDPIRYLGNRSSGRMGFSIVDEAIRRGARVILITGPTMLEEPSAAEVIRVRSASEMRSAVVNHVTGSDALIMSAAVGDYTVKGGPQVEKLSRHEQRVTLSLERTPDILAEIGAWRNGKELPILVGFAAETSNIVERARVKLKTKHVDLIVANDVSRTDSGFKVENNEATIVSSDLEEPFPLQTKRKLASVIVDRVEKLIAQCSQVLK